MTKFLVGSKDLLSVMSEKDIYAIPVDYRIDCYYHFLTNILFPLIELASYRLIKKRWDQKIFVPYLGPFERFVEEISLNLEIDLRVKQGIPSTQKPYFALESFDIFRLVDAKGFYAYRPLALDRNRLARIAEYAKSPSRFRSEEWNYRDITIIDRPGKRQIPNLAELEETLKNHSLNTIRVFLEDLSLEQQMKLFCSTKVIIAQHGSGLANLLWTADKPFAPSVIEIVPPSKADAWHYQVITQLNSQSVYCRLDHLQESDDSPIDVDLVTKEVLSSRFSDIL